MDLIDLLQPAPVQRLVSPAFNRHRVEVAVKRLDLQHPLVHGNKPYKLRFNILAASTQGYDTLLTFGGPWSNHLMATAAAARCLGLKSIGIVRGGHSPTPALRFAEAQGMRLIGVSREQYARKEDPAWLEWLASHTGPCFIIPEGGSNREGVRGCLSLLSDTDKGYDTLCCACGTGTTAAGLALSKGRHQHLLVFSPFKAHSTLALDIGRRIELFLPGAQETAGALTVVDGYHFGGFGKSTPELESFSNQFHADEGFLPDRVYNAKMFFALREMLAAGRFRPGERVLVIGTGGHVPPLPVG